MASVAAGDITGVILAGGRGQRLGGADKGLALLAGRPLVEYAIAALTPQVGDLCISANRNLERYAAYGYRVIPDGVAGYAGPLAGLLSAMDIASTPFVLCVPCDAPAVPADLGARLHAALVREHAVLAVAHDGVRLQPLFAMLHRALAPTLRAYLEEGGRAAGRFMRTQAAAIVDFSDRAQAFVNVNTPGDLRRLDAPAGTVPD
ncbi:MAG: molybdenum cofactor guanylyltransferase [Gammaproteobacteria bacterium]|nr:molybdenum cofactor guanylyltransferase [Gammaproteobacteria bacterium]